VIVLRYYEDLTETRTAEVMGCSIGTVKSQTAKALAKLRVDETITPARPGGRAKVRRDA
jgi:DNA-directed RNA polymerase specialized sigma24 family protein